MTLDPSDQHSRHYPDFADHREQALLEQAIALRPLPRSGAREAERNLADKVFRALCELDIWWLLLPRRWGGSGLSSAAFSRINREIARGDPSVAWVVQIINGTTWISSLTADALQRFWRDLNVAARHAIYNPDVGFEIYGRE